MYRVLIVDDEKIARDSVRSTLAVLEDLELEITAVESAVKAVSILEVERIDIAIMDINMPQMTGLELYDIVRKNWPQCKVIFLTGYSEFDYVYKVHKHAKYVLKADREEILVETVRESIREIENEMIVARAADIDLEFKRRAGAYRADVFINELIDGYTEIDVVTDEVLRDMNIPLDAGRKTFAVLLRCEAIAESGFERRQRLTEQIQLLVARYFFREAECCLAVYKKVYFLLLLQPKTEMPETAAVRRITNVCSLFQNALQLNAHAQAAILICSRALELKEAIRSFGLFYGTIAGVESGDTQLCEDRESPRGGGVSKRCANPCEKQTLRAAIQMEHLFEIGNRKEILSTIRSVREASRGVSGMHDLFLQEMYYRIAVQIIRTIKQIDISEQDAFHLGLMNVYNVSSHKSWERAFSYLEEVTEKVFDLYDRSRTEQQEGLVAQIKEYILLHLHEDTSLTALADHFHFSQEYLLRVFKKEEGVTILQYVNERKLERAKELLKDQDLQVKEVAEMLGFADTKYFIRFFRSKTGFSPKTYRKEKREN